MAVSVQPIARRWGTVLVVVGLVLTAIGASAAVVVSASPAKAAVVAPTGELDVRGFTIPCSFWQETPVAGTLCPVGTDSQWFPSEEMNKKAIGIGTANTLDGCAELSQPFINTAGTSVAPGAVSCAATGPGQPDPLVKTPSPTLLDALFPLTDGFGKPDLDPSAWQADGTRFSCTTTRPEVTDVGDNNTCGALALDSRTAEWTILEGYIILPPNASGTATIRATNIGSDGVGRAQYQALMVSDDADFANLEFRGESQTQFRQDNPVDFVTDVSTDTSAGQCLSQLHAFRLYTADNRQGMSSTLRWDPDGDGAFDLIPPSAFTNDPDFAPCGATGKSLTETPAQNADGTVTFDYRLSLWNLGSTDLRDAQIVDDLDDQASTFPAGTVVTAHTLTPVSGSACAAATVNPAYDGIANTAIFAGSPTGVSVPGRTLLPGGGVTDPVACQVDLSVTVRFPATFDRSVPQIVDNSAVGSWSGGSDVSEDVDDPNDPRLVDPNGNGDPSETDENTPTPAPLPALNLPALTLVKTSTPDATAGEAVAAVGDPISYSFRVTNSGNVTITNLAIDDVQAAPAGELDAPVTCPVTVLSAGAQTTCTATYTTTQADMDNGRVDDTATATGVDPLGGPVTSNPSSVSVPMTQAAAIEVVKSASPQRFTSADEQIDYTFMVSNRGNVPLAQLSLTDPFPYEAPVTCAPVALGGVLPVNGQTVCTAVYTTTQADVDGGVPLPNTVDVAGTPPATAADPDPAPVTDSDTAVIDPSGTAAITVVKSADLTSAAEFVLGRDVTYSFLVTNTGDLTLSDVTVDEVEFDGAGALSPITCPSEASSLAPGAQVTCAATYTITQDDVNAGEITNSAVSRGTPPGGRPPVTSPPSEVKLPGDPQAAIALSKTADRTRVTTAGQVIGYTFVITNTGNVTIDDPTVSEQSFNGHGRLSAISCPDAPNPLQPGQQLTCAASYTVVDADLTAMDLVNTATATGTPRGCDDACAAIASPPSTATVGTVAPPLAVTGDVVPWVAAGLGVVLLGGGAVLLLVRRRRIIAGGI